MTGVFRAGHNKPKPRLREPLRLVEPERPSKRRLAIFAGATLLAVMGAAWAYKANAHPGPGQHAHILEAPLAGVRNNYWYDYKSDVDEAENELRKDLRRAKTAQDKREAWSEYQRELVDARKDYRKEMVEKGYVRRGEVYVGDYDR